MGIDSFVEVVYEKEKRDALEHRGYRMYTMADVPEFADIDKRYYDEN